MENDTLPGPPTRNIARRLKLTTTQDLRRMLSRVIREVYQNELPDAKGRTLAYLLSAAIQAARTEDLEKRIRNLEQGDTGDGY